MCYAYKFDAAQLPSPPSPSTLPGPHLALMHIALPQSTESTQSPITILLDTPL